MHHNTPPKKNGALIAILLMMAATLVVVAMATKPTASTIDTTSKNCSSISDESSNCHLVISSTTHRSGVPNVAREASFSWTPFLDSDTVYYTALSPSSSDHLISEILDAANRTTSLGVTYEGLPNGHYWFTVLATNGDAKLVNYYPIVVGADRDHDGVLDDRDNCPDVPNGESYGYNRDGSLYIRQADLDGDGIGDACDPIPNG